MANSGIKFYNRYKHLTQLSVPFFRSSGQTRVVESAENFTQGYHQALSKDKDATASKAYPYPIIVMSEAEGSNNTLDHGLCTKFENDKDLNIRNAAQRKWQSMFMPPIAARLNQNLAGSNLTLTDTEYLMDLCPFNTVASRTGTISPFCALFSTEEWHQYDYFQSLGKYYDFGNGNPLGPTQGVGFTNELIARMTNQPVHDRTSVNHTLDDSEATFPIGAAQVLYADFSHDK